jgi:hypothetical protein
VGRAGCLATEVPAFLCAKGIGFFMDHAVTEVYQTPPLLFLFFWMGAMGMVVSTLRWVWMMRNESAAARTMWFQAGLMQVYIFIGCTLFSLVYTIYYMLQNGIGGGSTVVPELVVLAGVSYFFSRHLRRNGLPVLKGLALELVHVVVWCVVCMIGWALVVGTWYGVRYIIYMLSRNEIDTVVLGIFVTGFLVNAPVLVMHTYFRKKNEQAVTLKGLRPHLLVVPTVVAYLMLMAPLIIQEAMNSPDLKMQKYEKPLRKL